MTPLAVLLIVLLARSAERYRRYNLSLDFGIFHQAWHQIAHGNLSPDITPFGYPYWRSHFEIVTWLLAPLHWISPSGLTLLWLQDLALVAALGVAVWWTGDMVGRRWPDTGPAGGLVVVTVGLLGALNPWIRLASAQDFHFQAVGTLFTILAARDFWQGRTRRGWLWAALALSTGDVSSTYVAGVGIGIVLADRTRWRLGAGLVAAGAGWVAVITALDAGRGSSIESYGWVFGDPEKEGLGGAAAIAWGLLTHPGAVFDVLWERKADIARALVPTGLIGHLAPVCAGVVLVVLAANALHSNPFFVRPSYQSIPIYTFGLAGLGLAVVCLADRLPRWRPQVAAGLCVVLVAGATVFAARHGVELYYYRVDAATASDLADVQRQVKGDEQVVSSFGVGGRFSNREHLYLHAFERQTVPVREDSVVFVFAPYAGNTGMPGPQIEAVAQSLRDRLGAATITDGPRVFAFRWRPPPEVTEVTLSAPTS